MPTQIPLPVMPTWCLRPRLSKKDFRGDDADIEAAIPATDPTGEYPLLRGSMKLGFTSRQAADNTIILGVAVFGKLTISQLRTAEGQLGEGAKSRDTAHNKYVSKFQKLVPNSDNPMYDFILEAVQIADAEACLHNLGCAVVASRISNEPDVVARLEKIINRFVTLVVYETDILIKDLATGTHSIAETRAGGVTSNKKQDEGPIQIGKVIERLKSMQARLGTPASATATSIMPSQTIYLLKPTADRHRFWMSEENRDLIFSFYQFARGPMHIRATFKRNHHFWRYAMRMFANFCDNGFRMVIGIEKSNEQMSIEITSIFLRSARDSMIGPNRQTHQARYHEFNSYYNNQMLLASDPEQQITDIDCVFVDRYIRDKNVLKGGKKKVSHPQ